jgi:aromatic-L-amino-acid decarboxylase
MTGDIPPDEFRKLLHRAADWVADYREAIAERRVSPDVRPGELSVAFSQQAPELPEPLAHILADVDRLILPGVLHWGHPAFLAYFGSTTTAAGILAELIAAALNVSAMTWRTSPIATELETLVLTWLREMLGLPEQFEGVVYDTASISTLHALAAARHNAIPDARTNGISGGPTLRVYTSEQGHSHISKAMIALGFGEANLQRVAVDSAFRMEPSALREAIAEDLAAGVRPLAVVATVGTTSTTSVDPLPAIAQVCREHRLWLHVDAAYGGALALLPEGRWVFEGIEHADSVVINPHKWLFVPLDFSALYVRDPEKLRATFSLVPEYLAGDAAAAEKNYMDYGLQLGRRFRALKAWFVFRAFGRQGLIDRIREHCRLAQLLASWVESDPEFELVAPAKMGVVCFRFRASEGANREIVAAINASGRAYIGYTTLSGRISIRIGIGNVLTSDEHIAAVWALIKAEAAARGANHNSV